MITRPGPRALVAAGLAACVLVAAVPAPAQPAGTVPPDARALIDRHLAWLGGAAVLDEVRDISLAGTIRVPGLEGTLSTRLRGDGRQRVEYDLKALRGVECLDGGEGWERNPSGQIETMGRDKAAALRRALDRAFGRHLRGEGVAVTAAGDVAKDGRTWAVVRFTYPNGDLHDLLLDPETGESVWTRDVEDGREQWTRVSDLRVVDGVRVAFRQETFHEHAAKNQTVVWESVALNTGLDDDLFARPDGATARIARLPEGAPASEWLPVELYMGRWIYLEGRVNGAPAPILLDSGAGLTVLDSAFAASLGLRAAGAVAAQGTGGVTEAGMVEGVTLQLGDLSLGPLTAAVLDLSDVARRIGRAMPVILGKEVFHATVVDVDYPRDRIRFHDPDAFRHDGAGRRLDLLAAEHGHKDVLIAMEGGEPVVVGLDTGQGGALTVFGHYAQERGFLEGRLLSERKGGGVGGATVSKVGSLRSVTLAGYELRDVPVVFHQENVKGAFDTRRQAGNLGADILKRFRVVFDYGHDCLWLIPGPELDAPFPRDKTGLSLQPADGALTVDFVAPGGPAAAAGWREGERVTALDGEAYGPDWWRVYLRWALAPDGTVVRLRLEDGTERALTLGSYY